MPSCSRESPSSLTQTTSELSSIVPAPPPGSGSAASCCTRYVNCDAYQRSAFTKAATPAVFESSECDRSWCPWVTPAHVSTCGLTVNAHRSEEHTSELQSPDHLVCRLLLE